MHKKLPRSYSASGSITYPVIKKKDLIAITTAGIELSLPNPVLGLAGRRVKVFNSSAGNVSLFCSGKFLGAKNSVSIGPRETIDIQVAKSGSTYYWSATGGEMDKWASWVPTVSWTTATPTLSGSIYEYRVVDGICFFNLEINTANGAGATAVTFTPPVIPADLNLDVPVEAIACVDGTYTDALGYVDATNDTEESRLIEFQALPTFTASTACMLRVTGCYEVEGGTAFTGAETWGTADPGSITEVCREKRLGDVCLQFFQWSSADSNATSSLVCELAVPTPDRDGYIAARALEKAGAGGATWSDPLGYIDAKASTAATRYLEFNDWTTGTDGQAIQASAFAFSEISGWFSFDPDPTWGTADPTSVTEKAYYSIHDGLCFFWVYLNSADGNGANSLELKLPVPCRYGSAEIGLFGYEIQHTDVEENPMAKIPADQAAAADRNVVEFDNWTTAADTEAISVYVAGIYPIA